MSKGGANGSSHCPSASTPFRMRDGTQPKGDTVTHQEADWSTRAGCACWGWGWAGVMDLNDDPGSGAQRMVCLVASTGRRKIDFR